MEEDPHDDAAVVTSVHGDVQQMARAQIGIQDIAELQGDTINMKLIHWPLDLNEILDKKFSSQF